MKSWHIILIGIFVIIVVSMIIRYMAAKTLVDLAVDQNGQLKRIETNPNSSNRTFFERIFSYK